VSEKSGRARLGRQGNRILFPTDASRHSQIYMDQEVKKAQIQRKSASDLQGSDKNSVLRSIYGIFITQTPVSM